MFFSSVWTPAVSFFTMPPFHFWSFFMSRLTSPDTEMPMSPARWISSKRLPAVMRALLGMHPTFRQTPPQNSFSMISVFTPSCARRMAQG